MADSHEMHLVIIALIIIQRWGMKITDPKQPLIVSIPTVNLWKLDMSCNAQLHILAIFFNLIIIID